MAVGVSLLDSLDEGSQFDEDQSIVMESETLDNTNLHLDIGQSDDLVDIPLYFIRWFGSLAIKFNGS